MTQEEIQIIIDSDIPSFLKSALIKSLIDLKNESARMFKEGGEVKEKSEPKWVKSDLARTEGDTIYYTDDESKDHEYYGHYVPNQDHLVLLKPFYENLNDERLTNDFGADLDFVKRLDGDPGYFYSPEELLGRVAAASRFLKRKGITEITPEFLTKARELENDYGYNFRDLLHMYNDDNLLKMNIMLFLKGGKASVVNEEKKVENAAEKISMLMEEVIKPAAEAGNKTALRFLDTDKTFYTFTEEDKQKGSKEEPGSKGNVYVTSMDSYMVPTIQYRDGQLVFLGTGLDLSDPEIRELSIKFSSPEDAEFFASNYHNYPELIPMLLNPQYEKQGGTLDMTLEDILKLNISQSAKDEFTRAFAEGGHMEEKTSIHLPEPDAEVTIGDKDYKVCIADTPEKRKEGLSKCKHLPEDGGMLFVFEEPTNTPFTMAETSIDLDIIFIDEEGEVLEVHSVKAMDPNPVQPSEEYAYVLEVNYGSGVLEGDKLSVDSDEFTEEEKDFTRQNRMLMLDENGDVQFKLQGGERICSRIFSRKLIKAAIKAYREDTETAYRKVGKMIMGEFLALDNRQPQFVSAPEKKGEKDGE